MEKSGRFQDCINLEDNNPMVTFEPHVAEKVLQELLDAETNLKVYSACHLTDVMKENGRIEFINC